MWLIKPCHHVYNMEETFLRHFLVILKQMLQNYRFPRQNVDHEQMIVWVINIYRR